MNKSTTNVRNLNSNFKKNKSSLIKPMNIVKKQQMDSKFEDNIIDWTTYYRRNIHRFIEHYFGIKLHFYQIIIIYLMHMHPQVVLICARAVSKSFITSVYACAVCVLYPNSKVLATALTKKQASLLITEKVEKELMVMSPNLRREISKISTGQNATEVIFHNGSSFIVSVAGEGARGLRSTILITDEFRLVKKDILDSVLSPTEMIRPTPYAMLPEYIHLKDNPREIFLSSAYWKSHWMWDLIQEAMKGSYDGTSILFATDYALTIKHGIRSKEQMLKEKKKMDSTTYEMEYCNIMQGGSSSQYYSFELINEAQKLKKPFYPKTLDEYVDKSNKKKVRFGDINKQKGEIRIVSMDIALSKSTKKVKNDATVIKCIRALPNGEKYERQEVYIEAFEGVEIDKQAIRIRQVMEDFNSDYFVFDGRTYGTNLVDSMAKILYDEERDKEYIPLKVFNNESLANRCKNPNASPIMWAFIGGADTNHSMHTTMQGALKDGKYKMLLSNRSAKEEVLMGKNEYKLGNSEDRARYELPFMHSDLTLNEMVNLSKEYIQGGKIKLVEPATGTKDKYITSAMANLFIQELETELTSKSEKDFNWEDYFISSKKR